MKLTRAISFRTIRRTIDRLYKLHGARYLILQAGMGRAGSTLLFRLLQEITKGQRSVALHKLHFFDRAYAQRADLIFTARRDIRDVIASEIRQERNRRTLGFRPRSRFLDIDYLSNRHQSFYFSWKPYSSYEFVYERYKQDPINVISEIFQVVNSRIPVANADPEDIRKAAESSNYLEFDGSLHRTNEGRVHGYDYALTPEEVSRVENEWNEWLKEHGYE